MVCAHLLGLPDHYTNLTFKTCFWYVYVKRVKADWGENKGDDQLGVADGALKPEKVVLQRRKGEIMASVTGLLSNNDLFQTHLARDLDLYTRVDDEDWAEGAHAQPYSKADGLVDFDRLASSNGLRTTENLIDALFNPVPTANAQPSPFTFSRTQFSARFADGTSE